MLIGYARVSKADGSQLLDLQRDALIDAGVVADRIYEDRASGRKDHRPGLDSLSEGPAAGQHDGRVEARPAGARSEAPGEHGGRAARPRCGFRVLAGAGAEIDTTTANGRLVFGIFAALAEFERELIAERTRAGLAAARARGRLGGRPRKMDRTMLQMAMNAMASRETNAQDLARRLGITTTTLYMYVNGDGTVKAPGQKLLEAADALEASAG